MTSKRPSVRSVAVLISFFIPATLFATEQMDEIQAWLQKMQRATHTLNYMGTFVYGQREQLSSVNVIHRVNRHGAQERLIALDGTGREVIRDGSKVTCILPDSKAVVVSKSREGKTFPPEFPLNMSELSAYYQFSLAGRGKVAGRVTQRIKITPKDQYRYGHKLWVDKETGLLLKTVLLNERGKPIEQFVFTRIEYLDKVADKLLVPAHDGKEYTWYDESESKNADTKNTQEPGMKISWLPPGFERDYKHMKKLPNTTLPVEHMVYSDGLASISIYIEEELQHDPANLVGGSSMGAVSAHGKNLDDYHVTVVGEVPHKTVQKISNSVEYISND